MPFALLALILASLATASTASADAIVPLREPCPAPRVKGIRGHAEACLDPPPTDCPPGWRGVPGGECVLAHCAGDDACGAGERCSEVSLCMEMQKRHFCQQGERPAGLLAGPPMECPPGRDTYEAATDVCTAETSCAGECKKGKLCVAPQARASSRKAAASKATGAAGRDGGAAPPGQAPGSGGCAGCAVGASERQAAGALLLIGLGALCWRPRSRRPASRN